MMRWVVVWLGRLVRTILAVTLISLVAGCGLIAWAGSQPMDDVGGNSPAVGSDDISYWHYMAKNLQASRQTPANCHRTRLIYLAIALPVYPALYTYVALNPESSLARHVQPSELIPRPIRWRQAPETWWRLVEEISILAFTQPQWIFTPAVGQRVGVDRECTLFTQ